MSGIDASSWQRRSSGTVLAACLFVAATVSSWHPALGAPAGHRNIGFEGLLGGRMLAPGQMVISTSDINRVTVVPPGVGRLFVLQARDLIKYQITLSATTPSPATGSTTDGTKDFINWPRDDMCNGAALLAVAYREDQLPAGVIPPVTLSLRSPTSRYRHLINYISRDCQPQPAEAKQATASEDDSYVFVDYNYDTAAVLGDDTTSNAGNASSQQQQPSLDSYPKSMWASYAVLKPQIKALMDSTSSGSDYEGPTAWGADHTAAFMDAAFGEGVYAARSQVAESEQQLTELLKQADATVQQKQAAAYEYYCNLCLAELTNKVLNVSLSQGLLKECAPQGARVFVFVYNCLKPDTITIPATTTARAQQSVTNPEMLVSVKLDIHGSAEQTCMTAADRFVWYLNWTTLIIAGVVAAGFTLLFEVAPTLQHKLKTRVAGTSSTSGTLSHSEAGLPSGSSCSARSGEHLCCCGGLVIRAMRTMNSPSGHSRLYTIATTTTASLLVAAIVWQPSLDPNAQHDHAWFDNPIGPIQDDVTTNRAALVEFYLKVMGISALIGYTVKLALLANLGAPDAGSAGVIVPREIWRRQVAISIIGVAVLSLLVLSNASYMLNQSRAWVFRLPYMYLVAILILHYFAALVLFIVSTFIKPPPLASSSYQLMPSDTRSDHLQTRCKDETTLSCKDTDASILSAGEDAAKPDHGCPLHWLRAVIKLPGRLYASISEDAHLRYSSWILTPVWLSACLMIFWYLMGVSRSDEMVNCIRSPQDCVVGRLQTWLSLGDVVLDTQTMQHMMQVLQGLDQNDLSAGVSLLQTIHDNFNGSKAEAGQLERVSQRLLDVSNATQRLYRPYLNTTAPKLERWQQRAEEAYLGGRLLGYTLAFVFAAMSLINILKTFKRILLHRYLNTLKPQQQSQLIQQLEAVDSIEGRALARAMTLLRNRDPEEGLSTTGVTQWNPDAAAEVHPYLTTAAAVPAAVSHVDAAYTGADQMQSAAADALHQHVQPANKDADLQGYPCPAAAHGARHPSDLPPYSAVPHPAGPAAAGIRDVDALQAEAAASAALESAASAANQLVMEVISPRKILRSGKDQHCDHHDLHQDRDLNKNLDDDHRPDGGDRVVGPESNDGTATAEIMYTIQMLENDMSVYGIGASVALFGVLVSTMWIQIRVVGFILTVAATVLLHPAIWSSVMSKYWVSIVSLVGLILFNMFVVKRGIGSRCLSDGTYIKHRGAWMTFYLMCQLAFLVVGVLYATWRVIWALIVMLLYSVACLDRSILLFFKFLDGSYIAFVTSVKLESAWKEISQQLVDTQRHTGQQQDAQHVEAHLASREEQHHQPHTDQQQLQQQHVLPAVSEV